MSLPLPTETTPACKRFILLFEINTHSYWTEATVVEWLSHMITERELSTVRVNDITDIAEERDKNEQRDTVPRSDAS